MCVCMRVHVCVYILAMGLDPSELRQCFASCWAWEKDGTPFHSCLAEAWAAGGPLYPPSHTHTHIHTLVPPCSRSPPTHRHTHTPTLLLLLSIQAPAYWLSKAGPPSQPFINTSHYSSPSLHRDSKEISTLLARPEASQPFGPHKCKFRLSNLPVLIFVLKRCAHTFKILSSILKRIFFPFLSFFFSFLFLHLTENF